MSSKKNKPGTSATIFGSGFSATKTNNTVYFGTKKATIKTARAGSLKVTIPAGLRKGNIGVCVVVKGVKSNTVQFTIK